MKTPLKILFAAFIFVFIYSTNVLAGENEGVSFGMKGGVNFSNIAGNYTGDKPASLSGFHVGAIVAIGISSNFSVEADLLYTSKGADLTTKDVQQSGNNTVTNTTDIRRTLHYLEIPVLAEYNFESGFHFEAGPYLGILLSAHDKGSYSHVLTGPSSASVYTPIDTTYTNGITSPDFGVAFGVGYQLSAGLGFAFRYDLGLSDIYNPAEAEKHNNTSMAISLDYMFGRR